MEGSRVTFAAPTNMLDDGVQTFETTTEMKVNGDLPPALNGSDATLLDQYYANIKYFINDTPKSTLSQLRSEICDKIRHRSLFQSKVFGKSSTNFDVLPENAYSTFSVSLHLILRPKTFSFFTTNPGIDVTESFEDEGAHILDFISRGYLPPRMFEELRKLNLVWYDGGLICEIDDQRRNNGNVMRTLLSVAPSDIAALGPECESEFLLVKYPLISFDSDIQISKVSRIASSDALRWKTINAEETPKQYVQEHHPSIFLKNVDKPKEAKAEEDPDASAKALLEQLSKIVQ
ncbi:hypothetical protein TVAG_208620 [Trichomonas vaginalis G3]|uniref:Spt20-like SEP domain-containing protein n=1 Tax=Trichomonas vaginalis (strain ATCC PRA-98 / G3) TaxID=412133 RepID=A2F362_TRIV3|nr:Spt20 family [Trichomonas vaginalis G3]EAY00670.1 hypothetical protein TVAG_208620 [Trichomonas vaginalis G3]KAI5487192.1 Spt20 family [Trichomonas vaginalis G3]|eukprot:XP_001313599.1 hypothetical protein [Trichomonas vaginalis G3]